MSKRFEILNKIKESTDFLIKKDIIKKGEVQIGVILGSGLGAFYKELKNSISIKYEEIPNFPTSTVMGHEGKLYIGNIEKKRIILMAGRFHYYEGYSLDEVVFPIRVLANLGIKKLIITNAAGGINKSFSPGDLMIIEDHINFIGNPLIGPNINELGPRFPDMSKAYTPELRELAFKVAKENNIELKQGVYIGVTGPSYETPAEIKMMRIIGADAVGMSTIPEVIVARHMGLKILGISCITNMAAGILDKELSHKEVFETAEKSKEKFVTLVREIIKAL